MQDYYSSTNHSFVQQNYIHPTAIIGPNVRLGIGNHIGPYCVIRGDVIVGDNNHFESFISIGSSPEHKEFWRTEYSGVIIGNNCVVREYVTINSGTTKNTILKNNVIILRGAHVGHDAVIGNNVTLSCNALIGGHTIIGDYCNCGLGSIIHQNQNISEGCMLGMGAIITKKLVTQPYMTYAGNPARLIGENTKNPNYTIYLKDSI